MPPPRREPIVQKLLQDPLDTTKGLPIHGVNEFHPRPGDPLSRNNRAFLEARSINARMALRRLAPELTPVSAEATAC
jgi:hypothetical protein